MKKKELKKLLEKITEELGVVKKERDIMLVYYTLMAQDTIQYISSIMAANGNIDMIKLSDFTMIYTAVSTTTFYKDIVEEFAKRSPSSYENVKEHIMAWQKHLNEVLLPTYMEELERIKEEGEKVKNDPALNMYR